MTRLGLLLVGLAVAGLPLAAQPDLPRFEVASIKPNGGDGGETSYPPNGTLHLINVSLKGIIAEAYGVRGSAEQTDLSLFKLVGGPPALLSRSFDIEAKTTPGTHYLQIRAMLKTLLADRFKLRIRTEVRTIPLYALTVRREGLGPQLKRSNLDCLALIATGQMKTASPEAKTKCAGGVMAIGAGANTTFAGPLSQLIKFAQPFLDRPLIDDTGLQGNFEWSIAFRADLSNTLDRLTIFDAFRRDLGLRVESRTGPYEVLVINSVEMPTPN